ncbi:hypothetical protein HDU98_010176, partial [Podochytrium sp. JEL0797]
MRGAPTTASNASEFGGIDDIARLANLTTANYRSTTSTSTTTSPGDDLVARFLQYRYAAGQLFTRVGSTGLVAVNPVVSGTTPSHQQNTDAPGQAPHIDAFAARVFFHMLREQQDQSVLFL